MGGGRAAVSKSERSRPGPGSQPSTKGHRHQITAANIRSLSLQLSQPLLHLCRRSSFFAPRDQRLQRGHLRQVERLLRRRMHIRHYANIFPVGVRDRADGAFGGDEHHEARSEPVRAAAVSAVAGGFADQGSASDHPANRCGSRWGDARSPATGAPLASAPIARSRNQRRR